MSALSPLFLWLIPLALLPVIIHLLNRLRYQTVRWAAMMFLRSADRDASRRARIRQWLILAARCLMLLMFLLALARLQSRGRLARFFDPGSNLVVIVFDRSASMEQQRGGVSGRERALSLLQQGLAELDRSTRVLWMDSVDGALLPIPAGVDLQRLPLTGPTSTASDLAGLIRRALAEIVRADAGKAEIWIPTDRQSSAWQPEGSAAPDWSDWVALEERVTLRVLDVAQVAADPGNRALSLVSDPVRQGDSLQVELALRRESPAPESIPLRLETGGLTLQEDILVEGRIFQWVQEIPLGPENGVTHARVSLPADSNPRDNDVSVAWRNPGALLAGSDSLSVATDRILRAAFLPRDGLRIWQEARRPGPEHRLWMTQRRPELDPALASWVEAGGLLVRWPNLEGVPVPEEARVPITVSSWVEGRGILATRGRDPLRLDLVEVFEVAEEGMNGAETELLARLSDGRPLLTRRPLGAGAVYDWSTLPDSGFSNLDAGFVLLPVMQRLVEEALRGGSGTGTRTVGRLTETAEDPWHPLDGEGARPTRDAGRYERRGEVLALNRPLSEDLTETLALSELRDWAQPLNMQVFEDRSDARSPEAARSEFTGVLALLGLLFLVIESWLLTRNIRRPSAPASAWKGAAA